MAMHSHFQRINQLQKFESQTKCYNLNLSLSRSHITSHVMLHVSYILRQMIE